jgi:hypothetical protein
MQPTPPRRFPAIRLRLGVIAVIFLIAASGAVVAEPPARAEREITYEFIGPDRAAKGILTQLARGWMGDANVALDADTSRTLIVGRFSRPRSYPRVSKTTDQTKILSREAYRDFNWVIGSDDGPELNVLLLEKGTTSTTVMFIPDIAEEALGEDSSLVAANINSLKPRWPGANGSGLGREINYEFIGPNQGSKDTMISHAEYWMKLAGVSMDEDTSRTLVVCRSSLHYTRVGHVDFSDRETTHSIEEYRDHKWPFIECEDCGILNVMVIDRFTTGTTVLYMGDISAADLESDSSPVAASVKSVTLIEPAEPW